MPRVMRWSVYLDDGTEIRSATTTPEDVPQDGIQAVVEWTDNNDVHIHEGHEYYWWTGDCWAYGRLNSLERWLRKMCPMVKFGRFTLNAVHQKIMEDVHGRH